MIPGTRSPTAVLTPTWLAGSLDALRLTVVPVESLYWTAPGQVVVMTLLGGAGTTIFSAFVPFLPKGIRGTLTGGIHGRQSA